MSLANKRFSRRRIGRRGECRTMRPWLEILERRDCPAVQAFFAAGILSVVGDEGNNVIQLFQPRDRVVEVVGDGRTWVFEDVDEVFVDAGEGDDQATSSKPKEIVVVGSKIHLDVGAGNDSVWIDDGGPLDDEPTLLSILNYSVNLGTGADELRVAAENSGTLNLSVQSADGYDRHELGHTLGFRHEHIRPESIVRLDLAGSGNLVDVDFDNIEQVALSIVSQPLPAEPISFGGHINVDFHVIQKGTGVPDRDDGVVILYSSLPGGDAGRSSIGISPTSFSFSATAGGTDAPTSASASITTGDEDDTLSIRSLNVGDFQLDLDTGAGEDLIGWNFTSSDNDPAATSVASHERGVDVRATIDLGPGDDSLSVAGSELNSLQLSLTAGEGNDAAVIDGASNTLFVGERPPSRVVIDLGGGDDELVVGTVPLGSLELKLTAGDGNDAVTAINRTGDRSFFVDETGVIHASADLGAGNDQLKLEAIDFDEALIEVLAGDGDDDVAISAHAGDANFFTRDGRATGMLVDLGDGNNQLSVESSGFSEVTQDVRSGGGSDQIALSDRLGPFFDDQSKRLNQRIETGGGNDIVLDDTEGSDTVEAAVDLGSGNDTALVRHRMFAIVDRSQLNIQLRLGAGSDLAALDILGYREIAAAIDTGPAGDGRDLVEASFRLSPLDRLRRIRRAIDGRQDLVELFVAAGYDVQVTSGETTVYVLIGTPPS